MSLTKKAAWLACAAVLAPCVAAGQTAPAAKPAQTDKPAAADKEVEAVTVTAQNPAEDNVSIDRRSYSLGKDIQATSGSVADVLRNIPSVQVDVQGNVSLRGDPNVTIMIDGKPSGMFRGEGRGQALQQLPAASIERVEVMTNPSAAFSPEGSAGIINLVTKQQRGVGLTGSARANIGTGGRGNGGVSLAHNGAKLTLSGDAGFRRDAADGDIIDERASRDPLSGRVLDSRQAVGFEGVGDSRNLRAAADYDPDKATRIGAELRYNDLDWRTDYDVTYRGETPAGSAVSFDRSGSAQLDRSTTGATASYRRKFSGVEHELTANLSRELTANEQSSLTEVRNLIPAAPVSYEAIRAREELVQTRLKAEYKRPVGEAGKLTVGYEGQLDENDYDNSGARGASPSALVLDASLTNHFRYDLAVNGVYGAYQHRFDKLTVLAGLRIEDAQVETDQVTLGMTDSFDYLRAYPSLHLQYKVSDTQQLTASYSKRIQRPSAQDLNPFRVYQDPYTYREGNPRLEPQETHSFEVGYQLRRRANFYQANVFWRQAYDGVTDVVTDLGGGVFLTRKENLAESRSGGVELVATGPLTPKLSFIVSGNGFWNEIEASDLGFAGTRSGWSVAGYAALNWSPTAKDFVQVSGFMIGRQLTPQGYREPSGMLNIGYRHKLTERLAIVATVQDALNSFSQNVVVDTPTLRSNNTREINLRAAFVGLTWSFGGNGKGPPRRPGQEFDFTPGPAGGAGPL